MNFRRIGDHAKESHCKKWRVSRSLANGRDRFTLWAKVKDENERSGYRWERFRSNFDTESEAQEAARQISNNEAVLPRDYETTG